jgi:HSP20 family molecular chaperone IbpA
MTKNELTRKNHPFNEVGRPLVGPGGLLGEELFKTFFRQPSWIEPAFRDDKLWEDDKGTHIEYTVAGFEKEDIHVEFNDKTNLVTIKARKDDGEASRQFNASFTVEDEVSQEDIKTSYKNGIVRFDISKKEPSEENKRIHKLEIE